MVLDDKKSCVVIMSKNGYQSKMQQMINDRIRTSTYRYLQVTEDNTLDDLKTFRSFL